MYIVIVSTNKGMAHIGPFSTKVEAEAYAAVRQDKADDGTYIQVRELTEPNYNLK